MNPTDLELLEQFVTLGNQAAFEQLVARHQAMVEGVCRRILTGTVECDDAVQATFVALARSGSRLTRRWGAGDSLASWLHRVATNAALQLRRQDAARRRSELAFVEQQAHVRTQSQGQQNQWAELLPQLDAAIEQLPAKLQGPLVLCYLEGRTQELAAVELGISFGTFRRRLQRAKTVLQARLTRRNAALTGMGLYALLHGAAPAQAASEVVSPATRALAEAVVKSIADNSAAAGVAALNAALPAGSANGLQFGTIRGMASKALSKKGFAIMSGSAKVKAVAAALVLLVGGLYSLSVFNSPSLAAGAASGQAGAAVNSNNQSAAADATTLAKRTANSTGKSQSSAAPAAGASAAAVDVQASADASASADAAATNSPDSPPAIAKATTSPSYPSQPGSTRHSSTFFAAEINDNGVITRFDDPADAPQVAQFMADKLEQLKDANSELGEALAGQQGIEQFRAFVESLPKLPPGAAQEQPPEIAANIPAVKTTTDADALEEIIDARNKAKRSPTTTSKPTLSQAEREKLRKQKAGDRQARRRGSSSPSVASPGSAAPGANVRAGGFAAGGGSGSGGGSFSPGGNGASAFSGQINNNGVITNFSDPAEAAQAMEQLRQQFPQLPLPQLPQFNPGK